MADLASDAATASGWGASISAPIAPEPDASAPPVAPMDKKRAAAEEGLKAAGHGYESKLEGAEKRYSGLSDAYVHRMQQAIDAEGVMQRDLKPFDTQKELDKHSTSLWEAFGSPGFLIAMLGSAFSAQPMNSALLAGGAAMTALKKNDEDGYQKALEAWKLNTDLAVKRLDEEHKQFADISHLATHNIADYGAQLRGLAAKFDNQRLLALWDAGLFEEVEKVINEMPIQRAKALAAKEEIENNELKRRLVWDEVGESKDPQKIIEAKRNADAWLQSMQVTGKPETDTWNQFLTTKPTIEQMFQKAKELKQYGRAYTKNQAVLERAEQIVQEEAAKGNDIPITEGLKRAEAEAAKDTLASKKLEAIERIQKEEVAAGRNGSFERASKIFADRARAGAEPISDDTARVKAEQLMRGDATAVTGLGWGNTGSENRAKVAEMVTQIGKERGLKPEQIGSLLAQARLSYIAEMRGASALGQREALLTAGISATQYVIPRVLQTAKAVNLTNYPDLNKILMTAKEKIGDESVVRFKIAVETLINDYGRSFGTSSNATVSAIEHARALLQPYWAQGQIEAGVDQLMSELKSARTGILSGFKAFESSFEEGKPENADAILRIPIYVQSPEEVKSMARGQHYINPKGVERIAPGPE